MDRYQFEDLISQYLDNSLSLAQRKAFEDYIKQHPESQEKVDNMREILHRMKKLNRIRTSGDFTEQLKARLAHTNIMMALEEERKKRYFGLSPLYATALVAMVAGLIITGVQFFPQSNEPGTLPGLTQPMANESTIPSQNPLPESAADINLAEAEDDTIFDDIKPRNDNIDLGNQVKFVKDSPR
ncbi:MAG: anti-sigma factor family protein [Fidelibacterota bacterium]